MKIQSIFFILSLAFTNSFSNPNPCIENENSCSNNIKDSEWDQSTTHISNTNIDLDISIPFSCEEAANQFSECSIKKNSIKNDLCQNEYKKCINIIKLYKELCNVDNKVTRELELLLKSKCQVDSLGQPCPFSQNLLDIDSGIETKIDFSMDALELNYYDDNCRNLLLNYLNFYNENDNILIDSVQSFDNIINNVLNKDSKKQKNIFQKIFDKISSEVKQKIGKEEMEKEIEEQEQKYQKNQERYKDEKKKLK